jgi:general secretion pathway protein L
MASDTLFETCVAPEDARQSWPVEHHSVAALASLAEGRRVVLLWPAAQTRFDLLDIPVKHHSKAAQPARFALEESLAEEADRLHMIVAPRTPAGFPVISVQRHAFETTLTALAEGGVHPEWVLPEMLGLPEPEDQRAWALLDGGQLIVRHQNWGCFQCHVEDLEAVLGLLGDARPTGLTLLVVGNPQGDLSQWAPQAQLRPGFATTLAALLPQLHAWLAELAPFNLLQGPFAVRNELGGMLRPWRWPAALAATLVLLFGAQNAVTAQQLRAEAQSLEARNIERFRALFPDQTRIVDLQAQAEQQLALLRRQGQAQTFLVLLAPLSQALTETEGLQLHSLQFRDETMQVGLRGDSLQPLEALRQKLNGISALQYDVESADAVADGAQIRLRLQRRQGTGA